MLKLWTKLKIWCCKLACDHEWELFKELSGSRPILLGRQDKHHWQEYIYICPYCGMVRRERIRWKT